MKKLSLILCAIAVFMAVSVEAQNSRTWTIGEGSTVKGNTTILGGSQPQGGCVVEIAANASLFNNLDITAFDIQAFYAGGGVNCFVNIGPFQTSYTASFSKGWSFNIISATAQFMVGPIPVNVTGSIEASASISMTLDTAGMTFSGSAAGTGTASAAVGIECVFEAGIECECEIIGGTISANSQGSGTFTLSALTIYLKAYLELLGQRMYEYLIAKFGPYFNETYQLW